MWLSSSLLAIAAFLAIAIAIAALAIPLFLTRLLCLCHHHPYPCHPARLPATLVAIAIALPPSPSLTPATLIAIAFALVTLARSLFVARQPRPHRHHPHCCS
jgi:hypothetical protein